MSFFCIFATGVTALDWCQNVVSAQYLEDEWTEFNFVYTLTLTRSRLGLICVIFLQICNRVAALD